MDQPTDNLDRQRPSPRFRFGLRTALLLLVVASILMAIFNALLPRLTAPKMTTTVSFGSDESRCSGIIKDGDTPMIGYCIIEPPGESAIAVEGRDIMARGRLDGEAKFYLKGQRILPRSDGMRLFVYGPQGHWQELFIDNRELGQYIDEQGYPYSPKHFFDRYQDIADRTHQ